MKIKFVKQDLWIGLYWKTEQVYSQQFAWFYRTTYYLCLVPCFPIIWQRQTPIYTQTSAG